MCLVKLPQLIKTDCNLLNKCDMQFRELGNCVLDSWYKESHNHSSVKPLETPCPGTAP